jgi:hypothetical protein
MFDKIALTEVIDGRYGKPDTVIQHHFYTESGLATVTGLPWHIVYQWLTSRPETQAVPHYNRDFGWLFPCSVIDHLKAKGAFAPKKTDSEKPEEK